MNDKKFRVAVLTHGGANRLLELLHALPKIEVVGVFIETATEPQRSLKQKIKRSIRYDGYFSTFKKLGGKFFGASNGASELQAIAESQSELEDLAAKLEISVYRVDNYHSKSAIDLLKSVNADLGILYGTNIIKEQVFSIPRLGSINIHQGLAPIYRGGPTVFWELFNGENELGITVHFVAAKVDTGDIILQKTLPLRYDFARYNLDYESFLEDFRQTLKEPSAQMLAEAVEQISEKSERRIKQDTTLGKRYRLPTKTEKDALLSVLKQRRKQKTAR